MYILATAIFFLSFTIPFSDRFGLLSWVMIPFVIRPMLNEKYSKTSVVSLTLFSFLIYSLHYV